MFNDATAEIRPRLIMSLDGDPGTGRTRFALTAPRPIYVVLLDQGGLEGVLEDPTDVRVAQYDFRKSLSKNEAVDVASEVERDIIQAREEARTVVIDKATFLWQVIRLAEFGRLSREKARNYEAPNTRISELFRAFVESDTNLLLIHDQKDAYANDVKVGRARDGFNGVEGIVRHAALFEGGRNGDPFKMTVTRATPNWPYVGTEFVDGSDNPIPSFAEYAMQAVPQVSPDLWL
jgi:hypothetical protein